MSLLFSKRTLFSGIIAASSLSTVAFAAQPQEGFTVTPSIGHYHFDNDTNIDDDTSYSLGLGYQFNNPWGVEFTYLNADSKKNGNKVGVDEYRLDGIYNVQQFSTTKLTPYLAGGIGAVDYSKAADGTHTQVNLGGGVKYAVAQNLDLRGDFRLVNDLEKHKLDNVTSIGVQYTFGGPSHSSNDTSDNSDYSDASTTTAMTEQAQPVDQSTVNDQAADKMAADKMAADKAAADKAAAKKAAMPPKQKLDITFAKNSATVKQEEYSQLNKLATYLKASPDSTVRIEGYTDDSGKAAYNVKLSEKRAKAVADVLVNTFDISQDRITTKGYGEANPEVPNDTQAHREQNRRVISVLVNTGS